MRTIRGFVFFASIISVFLTVTGYGAFCVGSFIGVSASARRCFCDSAQCFLHVQAVFIGTHN